AGIATISSVLDAQVRVTRAHSNYNQALLDYQLARADLDFLTGSAVGE
ncbi:MAG: TolC family protein, partial [Desulfamplus sp.]|nr:TolC family protein [Desulfamplus sp.]